MGVGIFLFIDSQANGPHDVDVIERLLSQAEPDEDDPAPIQVSPETLAAIEGMKDWRPIEEVIIWERAQMLKPVQAEVFSIVSKKLNAGSDTRGARSEVVKLLRDRGAQVSMPAVDSLGVVLQANMDLLRYYNQYSERSNLWEVESSEFYPAFEILVVSEPQCPRDWKSLWVAAGGVLREGRMVAKRNDPIWLKLSDFNFPFPPFRLDNELILESVDRNDCEKLGIECDGSLIHLPPLDREFELAGLL